MDQIVADLTTYRSAQLSPFLLGGEDIHADARAAFLLRMAAAPAVRAVLGDAEQRGQERRFAAEPVLVTAFGALL